MKPKLFIASSVEGIAIAHAVHDNLQHDAEVTIWEHGVFSLSEYPVESLLRQIDQTDFGAFVFTPDDLVHMRDQVQSVARDNVIFELGLFIGRLGRQRNFIVQPRKAADFHLPTDLIGLTPATYERREDGNLRAALGPACSQIREALTRLKSYSHPSIPLAIVKVDAPKSDPIAKVKAMLPELMAEMSEDLKGHPFWREAVLMSKNWSFNGNNIFQYYYETHSDLESKFQILENHGLVSQVGFDVMTPRYRYSEELVEYLIKIYTS